MPKYDVVIVGSGIAALTAAYKLSSKNNVIIFTKSMHTSSNSFLAQGGIAACIGHQDTWLSHFTDTITAGCNHNHEEAVEQMVKSGPIYLSNLIKDGMQFDVDKSNNLLLGKEGAHSTRRILHAGGDSTGRKLVLHLLDKVKRNVQIIENEMAIDLLMYNKRCIGVETKNKNGTVKQYLGSDIILATGGCGGLYSFTSNDDSITGDGLAMAFRAGAELTDLEFIQFHPTLLNCNGKGSGLISEAVRGEGAILVNESGKRIMKNVHPLEDLAPRDVVARALFHEIENGRNVFLDISMIKNFKSHFPTITAICQINGIDIEKGLIPVIPGAHFLMGGVKTDGRGRTSLNGLYAVGEVACTGVHGANRLASNSLLEGIVYGNLVADDILSNNSPNDYMNEISFKTNNQKSQLIDLPTKRQIQQLMMDHVGIVRDKKSLRYAVDWLESYKKKYDGFSLTTTLTIEQLIMVNMITVGWLITTSALMRTESRGGHFRADFPNDDNLNWYKREIVRTNQTNDVLTGI
ncbi:L-aspartate oxidase [Virgibacillus ndiopensis]|uniref:L-aspartate oxidase n=1 Tax=Virgibacillus ndiopensis TaxID=2004408 RepID=UPI000C06EBA6|nr:L-aspartate oxidase [Virgibacillus ndiopensis]